jgi:sugar lactone lactonase YvrE
MITTVAGNGAIGVSGDGGRAIFAEPGGPTGVAVDASGNIYIADSGNHRVRQVNSAGTISILAGTGYAGFCGDGGAAASACLRAPYGVAVDGLSNVYIADSGNTRIRKVDAQALTRSAPWPAAVRVWVTTDLPTRLVSLHLMVSPFSRIPVRPRACTSLTRAISGSGG